MRSKDMEFVTKPNGTNRENALKIEQTFSVSLPEEMIEWWVESDGPTIFFGYKELQFFSIDEIIGEDIYELKKYMPKSIPICMDGCGNICVAKINNGHISGFYIADCGDLEWDSAKLIAQNFRDFLNDKIAPEDRLRA